MFKTTKGIAIFVSLLVLATFSTTAFGQRNFRAGGVYVLTNQVANEVAAFRRDANGMLTPAGSFATGGAGDPTPGADPLGSQGSLIMSPGNRFLFAVNAGSDEISVLRIKKNELAMVDIVDSGGVRPISLTYHDGLLYVLNAGDDATAPNITAFMVAGDGTLTPLDGSTQPLIGGLMAGPAEIGFSPDGSLLAVTEKVGNRIDTYMIDDAGLPSVPIDNPSNGMTPFGFAFNNSGTLIVSEAFGGVPNASAVSSYSAPDSGILGVISASVPNFQTASCWIVTTNSGKLAFVSNTGSGNISSYGVGGGEGMDGGSLTLLSSVAGTTGMDSSPIDMAMSNNSHFLYVHAAGSQAVIAFKVRPDGTLTMIDTAGGLPLGAQGIAAK